MTCKYKNLFGEPNKGLHFHVLGIAIIDLLLTIIAAYGISVWRDWNFLLVFLYFMIIAIVLHRIFCVNTTINKLLFGIV